jgi:hypothetical protein
MNVPDPRLYDLSDSISNNGESHTYGSNAEPAAKGNPLPRFFPLVKTCPRPVFVLTLRTSPSPS